MTQSPDVAALAPAVPTVEEALPHSFGHPDLPPLRPILEVWSVTKRFPKAAGPVLDTVDLLVEPGELVWIGGRNGVGKTTLLRVISGLITPDDGVVSFRGLDPDRNRREYQSRTSFLSAGDRGLYARLTVAQHLRYWAALCFIPPSVRNARIEQILVDFDLVEFRRRRVDRMSMGQRQRLRMALAFMHEPELVLLDEPSNSLDGEGRQHLASAIDRVLEKGGAGIVCSPSGDRTPVPCDAHYLLESGKLIETEPEAGA